LARLPAETLKTIQIMTTYEMSQALDAQVYALHQLLHSMPVPTKDCELGEQRQLLVNRAIGEAADLLHKALKKVDFVIHENDD
jgi:hypothetical protein